MTLNRDPETKEYIVINDTTGEEEGRFPTGSLAQAQALDNKVNAAPTTGTETTSGVPIAGEESAALPTELLPKLQTWNDAAKEAGRNTISRSDAAKALAYQSLGYSFEESLNLYSNWIAGVPNVPAPTPEAIMAWGQEQRAFTESQQPPTPTPGLLGVAGNIVQGIGTALAPSATGLPSGAEGSPVGQAILAVTSDPRVQLAMWHAVGSEGGYEGPWGTGGDGPHVGDNGDAVGPWQVNFAPGNDPNQDGVRERPDGTSITREQAADPAQSAAWMLSEFQDAAGAVPDELWQTDPGAAVAMTVAMAERPRTWNESAKTLEDAVAIYGRPETGPLAGGTGRAGGLGTAATGGYVPPPTGAAEIDTWTRAINNSLPQPFSEGEMKQGMTDSGLTGEGLIRWMARTYGVPLTAADEQMMEMAATLKGQADYLTPEDRAFVADYGLAIEDLAQIAVGQQKPSDWWKGRMAQVDTFLKARNLSWDNLQVMTEEQLTIPEFQVLNELSGGDVLKMRAIRERFADPEQAWQAAQLGYDPSNMTSADTARFRLQSDVDLQTMRLWEQIPENIKPSVNQETLRARYELRQAEARTQGDYLAPDDFLRSEYPGLFGGGTVQELRTDLAALGQTNIWAEGRDRGAGDTGARSRRSQPFAVGGGVARMGVAGATYPQAQGFGWMGQPGGMLGLNETGEMITQRALAQGMLAQQRPVGTQTAAELQARQTAIGARYPELQRSLARAEALRREAERFNPHSIPGQVLGGKAAAAARKVTPSGAQPPTDLELLEQGLKRVKTKQRQNKPPSGFRTAQPMAKTS
jgi:hypothetical protein